jgi:hypothetical protein
MDDNSGKMKVVWSIKGKIPNGPDFSNTTGTIYLDSFRWHQIIVAKSDSKDIGKGYTHKFDKLLGSATIKISATIVLIRAMPEDNNGTDIYKYLSYKFAGDTGDATKFDESPLMLIGSVADHVLKKQDITIWYNPDEADKSTEGVGKAATMPQPPNKATISILVGVSVSVKKLQTSSPTDKKPLRLKSKLAKKTVAQL